MTNFKTFVLIKRTQVEEEDEKTQEKGRAAAEESISQCAVSLNSPGSPDNCQGGEIMPTERNDDNGGFKADDELAQLQMSAAPNTLTPCNDDKP